MMEFVFERRHQTTTNTDNKRLWPRSISEDRIRTVNQGFSQIPSSFQNPKAQFETARGALPFSVRLVTFTSYFAAARVPSEPNNGLCLSEWLRAGLVELPAELKVRRNKPMASTK